MILPSRFPRRFHFGDFYRRRLSIDGRVIRFELLRRLECPSILQLEGFDFIDPSFVFRRQYDRCGVPKPRSKQERVISCFGRGGLFCRLFPHFLTLTCVGWSPHFVMSVAVRLVMVSSLTVILLLNFD